MGMIKDIKLEVKAERTNKLLEEMKQLKTDKEHNKMDNRDATILGLQRMLEMKQKEKEELKERNKVLENERDEMKQKYHNRTEAHQQLKECIIKTMRELGWKETLPTHKECVLMLKKKIQELNETWEPLDEHSYLKERLSAYEKGLEKFLVKTYDGRGNKISVSNQMQQLANLFGEKDREIERLKRIIEDRDKDVRAANRLLGKLNRTMHNMGIPGSSNTLNGSIIERIDIMFENWKNNKSKIRELEVSLTQVVLSKDEADVATKKVKAELDKVTNTMLVYEEAFEKMSVLLSELVYKSAVQEQYRN